ncbi:MAG: adenylosuccinate lyase, partial [Deltaproteobacteria bacterium]|nr:adenylosuccinate lyase [Deltaproteobacteria bacterium]
MISRYSREMASKIWSDENKYKIWLQVEILACEAWGRLGKIPKKALANIKRRASKVDISKIAKIEETVKHDVIAFLTAVSKAAGPDSRFIHMGLTSSDVLDTSFALQLKQSAEIILDDIDDLLKVLKRQALKYKNTPAVGRSHGIHAEPTSFGLKFALWYAEFERLRKRFECAKRHVSVGKVSGAVGTFANVPPQIEKYVCKKLGLDVEPVSTQIVQRDRHAHFFSVLALIASSIEKVATEIRHLQRTEVLEAEEPFTKGQKGSSAMPHKRNPVLSENLCGLARVVRANAFASMENVALWHERDISHSSVERVIGPDSTILIDFMLTRLTSMLDGLIVYPDAIKRNLDKLGGLIHSQRVMLALVDAGSSREDAYRLVQKRAMETWDDIRRIGNADFKDALKDDAEIGKYLSVEEIDELFDLKYHLKHVNTIYKRV